MASSVTLFPHLYHGAHHRSSCDSDDFSRFFMMSVPQGERCLSVGKLKVDNERARDYENETLEPGGLSLCHVGGGRSFGPPPSS